MRYFWQILIHLLSFSVAAHVIILISLPAEQSIGIQQHMTTYFTSHWARWFSFGGACLVFVFPLLMFLRWWSARRFVREISYNTEMGRVAVSLVAIEEAVTRTVEQDPLVKKVSVRIHDDRIRRCINIEAVLTLWDDGDVTGINKRVQDLICRRFNELLPDQTTVHIHLTVHQLNQRKETTRGVSTASGDTAPNKNQELGTDILKPPGLQATSGNISEAAGAALLAQAKSDDKSASASASALDALRGDKPQYEPQSATASTIGSEPELSSQQAQLDQAEITNDDDVYAQLYRGPQYPIRSDEDEEEELGPNY